MAVIVIKMFSVIIIMSSNYVKDHSTHNLLFLTRIIRDVQFALYLEANHFQGSICFFGSLFICCVQGAMEEPSCGGHEFKPQLFL